jgi:hypothetical protein
MEPGARMSSLCKNGQLVDRVFSDVKTFYEAVLRGKQMSNNGPCLGSRPGPNMPYIWISYEEVSFCNLTLIDFDSNLDSDLSLYPMYEMFRRYREHSMPGRPLRRRSRPRTLFHLVLASTLRIEWRYEGSRGNQRL